MENSECIFCKIIEKKMPGSIVDETDDVIVIKDIAPKATTHYLIIPKKHVVDVKAFTEVDHNLAGKMLMMANKLAQDLPEPKAFRLVVNNGKEAGQCVFHLHMHFLAGDRLPSF